VPLPESIPRTNDSRDACAFSMKWGIAEELARRLIAMQERLEFGVSITSGLRSAERQIELGQEGRPTAPVSRSTHTSCPATGADLWPQIEPTDVVKARLGAEAVFAGMRWGGGSAIDPGTGIPSDWPHVDLGPRAR